MKKNTLEYEHALDSVVDIMSATTRADCPA